jgi:hypothetical protein
LNQPYQHVAKDNNPYDGAIIGSAVAAGGAGAGMFGARMHYKGISARSEKAIGKIQPKVDFLSGQIDSLAEKAARKTEKVQNSRKSDVWKQRKTDAISNKLDKGTSKIERIKSKFDSDLAHHSNIEAIQKGHLHSRMSGGWKRAGIIGATALVGAGIGAGIDYLNK